MVTEVYKIPSDKKRRREQVCAKIREYVNAACSQVKSTNHLLRRSKQPTSQNTSGGREFREREPELVLDALECGQRAPVPAHVVGVEWLAAERRDGLLLAHSTWLSAQPNHSEEYGCTRTVYSNYTCLVYSIT